MKKYIYSERYFFYEDDPEFVSFFAGAVIADDSPYGPEPYIALEFGDGGNGCFSWMLPLDSDCGEESLANLRRLSNSLRRILEVAETTKRDGV